MKFREIKEKINEKKREVMAYLDEHQMIISAGIMLSVFAGCGLFAKGYSCGYKHGESLWDFHDSDDKMYLIADDDHDVEAVVPEYIIKEILDKHKMIQDSIINF